MVYAMIYLDSKRWTSGVVVNMSPCHGEDRGFDPHLVRHRRCSSMVEHQPSKLITRVRFPLAAPDVLLEVFQPL